LFQKYFFWTTTVYSFILHKKKINLNAVSQTNQKKQILPDGESKNVFDLDAVREEGKKAFREKNLSKHLRFIKKRFVIFLRFVLC